MPWVNSNLNSVEYFANFEGASDQSATLFLLACYFEFWLSGYSANHCQFFDKIATNCILVQYLVL